jgi:hypothetical protein
MSGGWKITWRAAGACLIVVIILLVTGWIYQGRAREAGILAPVPAVGARGVGVQSLTFFNVVPPPVPTADPAGDLASCGIAKVPHIADDDSGAGGGSGASGGYDLTVAVTPKTRERWESALLDSSDPRARAIGLLVHRTELMRAGSTVQAEESRDELVQLAAGAGNPPLYALANGLCRMKTSDADTAAACQRISLSGWTGLDPDNAVPWILTAQAARSRNDATAEATAFARAAETHNIDNYSGLLFSFGFAALPQDITPAEKVSLAIELVGYEAAWGAPEIGEISRYCSADALRRDEVHKECDAIAALLVSRGTTMLVSRFGARIGERVGWSSERLKAISQEREALQSLFPDEQRALSCETLRTMIEFMDKRAQFGELGALRELRDHPAEPAIR